MFRIRVLVSFISGIGCFGCLLLHASAKDPESAPRLPKLQGEIVFVASAEELSRAVANTKDRTAIFLKAGVYRVTAPLSFPTDKPLTNISLRGYEHKPEKVIITGPESGPAPDYLLQLERGSDVLISDLTFTGGRIASVALKRSDISNVRIYHCHFRSPGQHAVRSEYAGGKNRISNVRIEYCKFSGVESKDLTSLVEIQSGENWRIQHCFFGETRSDASAIRAWMGSKGTNTSANTFLNCGIAIRYGVSQKRAFTDHTGGLIANNFVVLQRATNAEGAPVRLMESAGTAVLHNTIMVNGKAPHSISVSVRTDPPAEVSNNLVDRSVTESRGAFIREKQSIINSAAFFESPAKGNLHLTRKALRGLKKCDRHGRLEIDWDGDPRPAGKPTFPGADVPTP